LDVHRDLLREVALGHGRRHFRDVAHLPGQVRRHEVDRVSEVAPGAGHVADVGLAAEPALGADLAGDAGHLRGEAGELIDHRVDRVFQLEDFAPHVHGDLLGQVAYGDAGRHVGDVAHLAGEVRRHRLDVAGQV